MKKVVIADHHPVTRHGIRNLLPPEEFKITGEVSHGDQLLETLKKRKPCILILELNMPGIKGFRILKEIKKQFPKTKTVIFSSFPQKIYALHCIKAGASGYFHKTTSSRNFSSFIKKISDGKILIEKEEIDIENPKNQKAALTPCTLSARETEVLNFLLEGHRNKEIAQMLKINEKTVSTYKSRLMKKLNLDNLAALINHSDALPL